MKKILATIMATALGLSAWGFTYMSGSGTEADPYKVGSAEALAEMSTYFSNPGKTTTYIKITQSFTAGNYTPPMIGNQGSGTQLAGHTVYIYADENVVISGLTVQSAANGGWGLIGDVHNSTKLVSIKNITLDHVTINGGGAGVELGAGAFVGCFAGEKLILENCHVQNSTIGNSKNVGGLVGYCSANGGDTSLAFNGCSIVDSTLGNSTKPIGGFVGYCLANTVTISNSVSSGNTFKPTTADLAGAFVGRFNGDATNGQLSDVTTTGNKVVVGSEESTEILLVATALNNSTYVVTNEAVQPTAAVTNTVQSSNLFGAIKVTGLASNMFVALPFEGFESAGAARKARDAVHPAGLADGTKMYVYDSVNGKYDVFETSEGVWTKATKVTVGAGGKVSVDDPDLDRGLGAGSGVIVDRKTMDDAVYVYGQIPAAGSLQIAAGSSLVCAPSTNALAEVDLNALTWEGATAGACNAAGTRLKSIGDVVRFRGPDNRMVNYYYFNGKWGPEYRPSGWNGKAIVPAGTAFWYTAKAAVTMSW